MNEVKPRERAVHRPLNERVHSNVHQAVSNTVRSVHVHPKYEQVHELSFNERVQAQHCLIAWLCYYIYTGNTALFLVNQEPWINNVMKKSSWISKRHINMITCINNGLVIVFIFNCTVDMWLYVGNLLNNVAALITLRM